MGTRINRANLQTLELGAYGLVPAKMAHFCQSKTETILQVHGMGPFSVDIVEPLYELSEAGVSLITAFWKPAQRVQAPPGCFTLKVGDRVRGALGEGSVVGAQCSPANQFTQYWIQKQNGERFWATAEELNPQ